MALGVPVLNKVDDDTTEINGVSVEGADYYGLIYGERDERADRRRQTRSWQRPRPRRGRHVHGGRGRMAEVASTAD